MTENTDHPNTEDRAGFRPASRAPSWLAFGPAGDVVAPVEVSADPTYGDVAAVTRTCRELTMSMLDGVDVPQKIQRLGTFVAQCARDGVPIGTIHESIHAGLQRGLELAVATPAGYENLARATQLVVELLDPAAVTVSAAYVREARVAVSAHQAALTTLATALLEGRPTSTMARECGIEIAESYHVLAVSISDPLLERRALQRIRDGFGTRTDGSALSLFTADDGTVLIPEPAFDTAAVDDLIANVSRATETPLTAIQTTAAPGRIPDAAAEVHELLGIARRLEWAPGLYRFDDLAPEFQLTRPGPGRVYLGSLLNPLDAHPELLETLQRHIGTNLNRQRTARLLHVHTNTVDYRLKRIGRLTGFDPGEATGVWYLRAALVARACTAR